VEIPSNVQARINDIIGRFEPQALTSPSTGTDSTTGTSSDFAAVLAETLGASDTTNGITGTGETNSLASLTKMIAQATTARTGAVGSTVTPSASKVAGTYGIASSSTIATKQAVSNLEGMYENGRLPDEALTPIGVGPHRLAAPAASAFKKMQAAAEAAGVDIGVTDSYRDYDAQVDVANRKGLYSQGGLAAKPGTSDHGLGLALDLDLDANAQTWMRANAGKFGFVEDTPRESWHWKFDGV
jgi:hypothetical protein